MAPPASVGGSSRPTDPVEKTEPWQYAGRPGKALTTANYKIWTTDHEAVTVARLPLFLEEAMHQYRTGLATLPAPPAVGGAGGRLDTFIMANRMQWELLTRQLMGERAEIYLQIPSGGYASGGRAILYEIGGGGTLAVAAHEGWHQYTQRTFREGLPVWLEEGAATFMEGHRFNGARPVFMGWANVQRFDQLRTAAAKRELMGLRDLLEATPQGLLSGSAKSDPALTYYGQVWALVHFLREDEGGKNRAALERLLSDAAEGRLGATLVAKAGSSTAQRAMMARKGPAVFEAYFGDLDRAAERYAAFVGKIVRTGSRQAIAEGRSPISE